jgi:hypothetical protein
MEPDIRDIGKTTFHTVMEKSQIQATTFMKAIGKMEDSMEKQYSSRAPILMEFLIIILKVNGEMELNAE